MVIGNPAKVVCKTSEYIEKNRERMKKSLYMIHIGKIRQRKKRIK